MFLFESTPNGIEKDSIVAPPDIIINAGKELSDIIKIGMDTPSINPPIPPKKFETLYWLMAFLL